jgi:hypothetical protein
MQTKKETSALLADFSEGRLGAPHSSPSVVKAFEIKATDLDWSLASEMLWGLEQEESSREALIFLLEDVANN